MEVLPAGWPLLSQSNRGQDHDREDSPMPDRQPAPVLAEGDVEDTQDSNLNLVRVSSNGSTIDSSGTAESYQERPRRLSFIPNDVAMTDATDQALTSVDIVQPRSDSPVRRDPQTILDWGLNPSQSRNDPNPEVDDDSDNHRGLSDIQQTDRYLERLAARRESLIGPGNTPEDQALAQSAARLRSAISTSGNTNMNERSDSNADRAITEEVNRESMESEEQSHDSWIEGQYWTPIEEGDVVASEEDLRRIMATGEHHALDHKYWQEKTFQELSDPEFVPIDTGRIEWTIHKYNGTKESPQKELIMRSDPVTIGGYKWRIKVYPRGNESEFLAAYIEMDGKSNSETPPDQLKTMLPLLNGTSLEQPLKVPVQFSIIVYNPQEPRVNYYNWGTHSFTSNDTDRGFARFGHTYFHHLGQRLPDQRRPLLQNDTLAFIAHIRIVHDPTGFLFETTNRKSLGPFRMTGLQALDGASRYGGCAANLISAVAIWSMLPSFRRMIYEASPSDDITEYRSKPLVKAFQQLFCDLRREPHDRRGFSYDSASVEPISGILTSPQPSEEHSVTKSYAPWHSVEKSIDDFDVMQIWCLILDRLKLELGDEPNFKQFECNFTPGGLRIKLPPECRSIQEGLEDKAFEDKGTPQHPRIMQVELPRTRFCDVSRNWIRTREKIKLNEKLDLSSKGTHSQYKLYGLVLQNDGYRVYNDDLRSKEFNPLVRPDGENWFKFTTVYAKGNNFYRLTRQQALIYTEASAYIAIYLRQDLFDENFSADATTYLGVPETTWEPPLRLSKSSGRRKFEDWTEGNSNSCARSADGYDEHEEDEKADGENEAQSGPSDEAMNADPTNDRNEEEEESTYIFAVGKAPHHKKVSSSSSDQGHSTPLQRSRTPTPSRQLHAEMSSNSDSSPCRNGSNARSQDHTIDFFASGYYQGMLQNGLYHGHGHRIYLNGDIYTGEFRENERHGHGKQVFRNGDIYEGAWENNKQHGRGTFIQKVTSNKYDGGWKDGKQCGQFTLTGRMAETMSECLICYGKDRDVVFDPCGHVCSCVECARQVKECPVCKRPVDKLIKFWMV